MIVKINGNGMGIRCNKKEQEADNQIKADRGSVSCPAAVKIFRRQEAWSEEYSEQRSGDSRVQPENIVQDFTGEGPNLFVQILLGLAAGSTERSVDRGCAIWAKRDIAGRFEIAVRFAVRFSGDHCFRCVGFPNEFFIRHTGILAFPFSDVRR